MVSQSLYLESQIIWGIVYLILIIFSKHGRKIILFGSLAAIPLAFTHVIYKDVWKPEYLLKLPVGIEDFLFCFLMGGISIALVVSITSYGGERKNQIKISWYRSILIGLVGLLLLILLYISGIRNYLNNYISMAVTSALIIAIQRNLWKVFLIGSISVAIVYSLALQPGFLIWPDLLDLWVKENLSGILLGKAPIEEIIWAFLFGGTWPVIIYFVSIGPIPSAKE